MSRNNITGYIHNNIGGTKAHEQLLGAFKLMSLPEERIKKIRYDSHATILTELEGSRKKMKETKLQLEEAQEKL